MIFFIAIGVAGAVIVARIAYKRNLKEADERRRREDDEIYRRALAKQQAQDKVAQELKEKLSRYGYLSKEIALKNSKETVDKIYVFNDTGTIIIYNTVYHFADILNFEIIDNHKTIYSNSSSTTKTSTGDMIGRAVVGGVLLGGVGALMGAATAKKETTFTPGESEVIHDYSIVITINSIQKPKIQIKTGSDGALTQELLSLLKVVCSRNSSK
mgnify:FL=1